MVERTVTYILDKLAYTLKESQRSRELEVKYLKDKKYSRNQSQRIHTQALIKRSKSLKKELEHKIFSNIYKITYLTDKDTHIQEAILTNVNENEARKIMQIWAKTYNVEIKILEIKKIPTFIQGNPL